MQKKEHWLTSFYIMIRDLIKEEKFEFIDEIIKNTNPRGNIDYILVLLISTVLIKNRLRYRKTFYKKVSWRLDCLLNKSILSGLK